MFGDLFIIELFEKAQADEIALAWGQRFERFADERLTMVVGFMPHNGLFIIRFSQVLRPVAGQRYRPVGFCAKTVEKLAFEAHEKITGHIIDFRKLHPTYPAIDKNGIDR